MACWAEVGNEVACTGCVVASLTYSLIARRWNTNTARVNGRVSKRSHSPNAIVIYNSYHLKRSEQIRSLCDGRNVCLFVWLSERASEQASVCLWQVKASKSSSCSSCLCDLFSPARCGWIKKSCAHRSAGCDADFTVLNSIYAYNADFHWMGLHTLHNF